MIALIDLTNARIRLMSLYNLLIITRTFQEFYIPDFRFAFLKLHYKSALWR